MNPSHASLRWMTRRQPPTAEPRCAGSVLVIVLITVLLVTSALVAFMEKAGDQLIVDAREATAKRLRVEAYSALEVTLAVLEDFRQVNGGLHSPAEGWSEPLAFAGWTPREGCTAEVSFEDESGKISLPHVEAQQLQSIFEAWGLAQRDAEKLRDGLLSWMRKDYVASDSRLADYEHGTLPYSPPYRSLRTFAELAAIDAARDLLFDKDGRPNELWRRFVDTFSLLDFKSTNVNSAGPGLLTSLNWMDKSQQKRISDYLGGTGDRAREGPGFFESTSQAANLLGLQAFPAGFGTEISALRVIVTIHQGRTAMSVSATVAPTGGATVVRPVPIEASSSKIGGQNAASSAATKSTNPPANTTTGANAASSSGSQKLNYPFTLLEIRENAMISTAAAASTKA